MESERLIAVEVVYAPPDERVSISLAVPWGTTAREAIILSGLPARRPEIDAAASKVGIFGRVVANDTVLGDGDRVEIYRPLVADPKQARRRRAARDR